MRIAAYARVSTENQLENYSIPQQVQRLTSYCQARGWELVDAFVDRGFSGGNLDRPALGELIKAVRAGRVDAVLVYKLDRLSRSQKDTLTLIEDEFLAHGVDFISINENFDTSTPFGRAMIGMLSVFAQLERDQITERFTMGRVGRSKAGYFHGGGSAPTGYDYRDGLLQVNEYQALQVREAFRLFLSGQSVNAVSRELAAHFSHSWTPGKVRRVLKNSLYTGHVHFDGQEYPGIHAPIIDQGSFDAANRLLKGMAEGNGQRSAFRVKYLLSGLLYCGDCGARFAAGHGAYRCYSRSKCCRKYVRDPDCPSLSWPIDELDRLVWGQVCRLLSGEQTRALFGVAMPRKTQGDEASIRQRLEEIRGQMERLVELYQLGGMAGEEAAGRISELEREQKELSAWQPSGGNKKDPTGEFLRRSPGAGVDVRRAFISALVEGIELRGRRVEIRWRV